MTYSTLRKVGGSVMVAVPPALLDQLHLEAGATVGIAVEGDQIVLRPAKPRYKLADLLAECDYSLPRSQEEQEWLDAPAVGGELI
jgi:antitoxin ChpS